MPAHTMSDAERFASKTTRDPDTGCLLWMAARLKDGYGYGVFSIRHKTVRANRWSLEQKLGRPLRPGMFACHTCDNPPCVEPTHLYEGTPLQNSADTCARGRVAWGERITTAVLDAADVRSIRRLAREGLTHAAIGERFGVDQSTVSRIANGKRWGRLEVSSGAGA